MLTLPTQSYEYVLDVGPDDIDAMGHVNNAVYLQWIQVAVLRHWRRFAPTDVVAARLWVALKHEIRYRQPAFLDDRVVVRLLLDKLRGALAFYRADIDRENETLAEVKSCWCCLDAVTRKPVRLARDIVARFLPPEA
jgi:acyl-CoA thioester hydrolase